jgi:hypothetical protein
MNEEIIILICCFIGWILFMCWLWYIIKQSIKSDAKFILAMKEEYERLKIKE